jgi:hypothetical protein
MKTDGKVPTVSNKQKQFGKTYGIFVSILKSTEEKFGSGSGFVIHWYASPDPYQNVTDLEHCF